MTPRSWEGRGPDRVYLHGTSPEVTLDEMGQAPHLVPAYEDTADAETVLNKVCREIFCLELEAAPGFSRRMRSRLRGVGSSE